MSVPVTPLRAPPGAPSSVRIVSPELVLVDPVLAAEERERLAERPVTPPARSVDDSPGDVHRALQALATAALEAQEPRATDRPAAPRSWSRLVVVAGVTVSILLLLDVRVEVGRNPAIAGSSSETAPPVPGQQPTGPAAREVETPRPPEAAKPTARRFAWAPVSGADAYRVELFRANARVFVATSSEAQLTVPPHWRHEGKRRTLTRGTYRWYVWSITGGVRAPNAIVQATVTVP
jgi:hypothetical protein